MKTALRLIPILLVAAGCSSDSGYQNTRRSGVTWTGGTNAYTTGYNYEVAMPTNTVGGSSLLSQTEVDRLTSNWKATPKQAAKEMAQKYGPPTQATAQCLIWQKPGTFKRIELINEEIEHNFPQPHKDCLKHVIEYKVPPEKFGELAQFDGSIVADRTAGELSARCDSEAHNLLALNLAYQVLTSTKSVDDARSALAEMALASKGGQKPPMTEKLQFLSPTSGGEDPDQPFSAKPPGERTPTQPNQQQIQQDNPTQNQPTQTPPGEPTPDKNPPTQNPNPTQTPTQDPNPNPNPNPTPDQPQPSPKPQP